MQKLNKPDTENAAPYRINDPEEFTRNILKLFEEGGRAMTSYLERADTQMSPFTAASEVAETSKIMGEIAQRWMTEPVKLVEAQCQLRGRN